MGDILYGNTENIEIPHKIFYPYIEKYNLYIYFFFTEVLDSSGSGNHLRDAERVVADGAKWREARVQIWGIFSVFHVLCFAALKHAEHYDR